MKNDGLKAFKKWQKFDEFFCCIVYMFVVLNISRHVNKFLNFYSPSFISSHINLYIFLIVALL